MNIQNVFINLFAYDYLDVDNSSLEEYCRKEIHKEELANNITQSLFLDLSDPVLAPLISQISERMQTLHSVLGFKQSMRQQINRAWCNLNTPYDINIPHSHPESFFTGVYYVKAYEDCPPLTFMTPMREMEHVIRPEHIEQLNHFNSARWTVKPETGKLVIFPSWLLHYVTGQNTQDRISIAFDANIMPT